MERQRGGEAYEGTEFASVLWQKKSNGLNQTLELGAPAHALECVPSKRFAIRGPKGLLLGTYAAEW